MCPFEPKNWRAVMPLYAVSSFITAALLIFGLILGRTALRLWVERSKEQLGARFKTKMVVGAMAISLLPIMFMFFVSYSLLNRTLCRWFPRPLEIASEQTQELLNDFGRAQLAAASRDWPCRSRKTPTQSTAKIFCSTLSRRARTPSGFWTRTATPSAAESCATTSPKIARRDLRAAGVSGQAGARRCPAE